MKSASKFFGLLVILASVSMVPAALFAQDGAGDALQAYRNGQYQTAIDITLRELKADAANMDSYAVLCWSLDSLKRYQEAIDYAQKGRQINPSDHRLIGVLAEANYALKNDLSALGYYQQYLALSMQLNVDIRYVRDAYRDLGDIFIRIGEFHHADIALAAAIANDRGANAYDPVHAARLWARLGYAREQAQDFRNSLVAYDKAISLDSQNTDAHVGHDRVRQRLGPDSPAQG